MPARVPDRKRKHAAKFPQARLAPTRISLEHDFSIRVTDEISASLLKFFSNVTKVVNLPVVYDPVAALGIVHRLMCQRRKIQNRQTPVPKSDLNRLGNGIAQQNRSRIIRAAMRERLRTTFQYTVRNSGVAR